MPSHDGDNLQRHGHGTAGRVELLRDLDRPRAWMLLVDGVTQSHVDLDDPWHLELEYARRIGHLVDLIAPAGTPLRVLHLGGGGLTLARYVAATRPGSRQLAVESDPDLAQLVRRRLPFGHRRPTQATTGQAPATTGQAPATTGNISVLISDARTALADLTADSFDVVVTDVFAGGQTPAHLTSVEFTIAAARVLAPSGSYAVNIGDGPPLTHARGRVATVCSIFRHACLIAEPSVLRGRRFGNLVVAAADHELPVAELARRVAADPFPARLLEGSALAQFVAGAEPITDAHARPSPAPPPGVFA